MTRKCHTYRFGTNIDLKGKARTIIATRQQGRNISKKQHSLPQRGERG